MPIICTVATAATGNSITLDDAKLHLRETGASQDELITSMIPAAFGYVEMFTGRQLMKVTYDMFVDEFWGDNVLELPRPPLLSVDSITYLDGDGASQTLGTSIYTVDTDAIPARVYLAADQSWPTTQGVRKAVTVRFTAGYSSGNLAAQQAAVPATMLAAGRLILADLFESREARLDLANHRNPTVDALLWSERVFLVT